MTRDLREAIARFEAAAAPRITYRGLQWPEFETFLGACASLERRAAEIIVPGELKQTLAVLRTARNLLRILPISPSSLAVGLNSFLEQRRPLLNPELEDAISGCEQAARHLLESDSHPALSFFAERVNTIRSANPSAAIHVVVSRDCVSEMKRTCQDRGLDVNVHSLKEAKLVDTGTMCFIFGSPESLHGARIRFETLETLEREASWLFTAPIANEVCVVSWPGNRGFKVDRYAVFPGMKLELTSRTGPETFRFEPLPDNTLSEPTGTPVFPGADSVDGELVRARIIDLAGGYWVAYAEGQEGPRPNRIAESDFQLVVEDLDKLAKLQRGDRLVIRNADADRRFLDEEARSWLADRYGPDEPDHCWSVRDRFREGIQRLEKSSRGMLDLRAAGFADHDIRYRFRLSYDRNHIAPDSFDEFKRLSKVCGHDVTEKDWDHIRRLRSALKVAGRKARQLLEDHVARDDSWMDPVDRDEVAEIQLGDMGSLLIARVLRIREDIVHAPLSHLGQAIRSRS